MHRNTLKYSPPEYSCIKTTIHTSTSYLYTIPNVFKSVSKVIFAFLPSLESYIWRSPRPFNFFKRKLHSYPISSFGLTPDEILHTLLSLTRSFQAGLLPLFLPLSQYAVDFFLSLLLPLEFLFILLLLNFEIFFKLFPMLYFGFLYLVIIHCTQSTE